MAHAVLAYGGGWLSDGAGAAFSQTELQSRAGISRAAYYKNLRQLEKADFLCPTPDGGPRFSSRAGLVLGLSVGGSETLRAVLCDANGRVLDTDKAAAFPNRLGRGPEAVANDIARLATRLLRRALANDDLAFTDGGRRVIRLLGIAVAWPLPLDRGTKHPTGIAHVLEHSAEWVGESIEARVARALHIDPERSHALNDANATVFAVAFDRSRRPDRFLFRDEGQVVVAVRVGGALSAGTAIIGKNVNGRSAFLDTSVIEGWGGFAGEIGHLEVPSHLLDRVNNDRSVTALGDLDPNEECSCHVAGHLEAYCSATALEKRIRETPALHRFAQQLKPPDERTHRSDMRAVVDRLDKDPIGSKALEEMGHLLGEALVSPTVMLNPVSIILTGSCATESLRKGIFSVGSAWLGSDQPLAPESRDAPLEPDHQLEIVTNRDPYITARGAALRIMRAAFYSRFDDLGGADPTRWMEDGPLFDRSDLEESRRGAKSEAPLWPWR